MATYTASDVFTYNESFDADRHVAAIHKGAEVIAFPHIFTAAPTAIGAPFVFTAANWTAVTAIKFSAYFRALYGTVYVDLYDVTAAAQVSGSQLSTASLTDTLQTSAAITLVDGHTYVARTNKSNNDAGMITATNLIAEIS